MRAAAHKVSLLCAPGRRAFSAGAHALPALPSDAWASSHLSPAVAFLLRSGSYAPSSVHGTGRAGRILKADVLKAIKEGSIKQAPAGEHAHAAAAASPAAAASAGAASVSTSPLRRDRTHTDIPLTNVRKVIASRLSASKQTIPHAYSTTTLRMDAILKLRAALKDAGRESIPSVNDFIIRASALALRTVPAVNSIYASKGADVATPSSSVDISVAVATPTGLITPIVKNADTKRLDSIGAEVKELANRAKANKLKPEEFQGGSFTISNLGMFGVTSFSAIINPPQTCILAVGGSVQRVDENAVNAAELAQLKPAAPAPTAAPVAAKPAAPATSTSLPFVHSSAFAAPAPAAPAAPAKPVLRLPTSTFMSVTLVSDERAVDGETAAQWLAAFKGFMENPASMQ